MNRLFLVSPASCGGKRAGLLFSERARSDLALRLRADAGVPLGQVFSFLSSLYFRGKLAYARAFAAPPPGVPGVLVITSCAGLKAPDERVGIEDLRRFGEVPIDARDERYREPLLRDVGTLETSLAQSPDCEVVLLGSVASGKYVELLSHALGPRLRFPSEFVGRGDMSRGGLMLRCVEGRSELLYVPVGGAVRHGPRPPRLTRRPSR